MVWLCYICIFLHSGFDFEGAGETASLLVSYGY
jgi:hypothetical protein